MLVLLANITFFNEPLDFLQHALPVEIPLSPLDSFVIP